METAAGTGKVHSIVTVEAQEKSTEDGSSTSSPSSISISPSSSSIYNIRSRRSRLLILPCLSISSIIVPLSETIYLPATQAIQTSLHTTPQLVFASVALYMFACGAFSFIWGVYCDDHRIGRRAVLLAGSVLFLAATLGCIFANCMQVLLAARTLQGVAAAAISPAVTGVVADVFPPAERGLACGICNVPLLAGPILGPILGGSLTQAFGYRATFVALAGAGTLVLLLLVLGVPETLQWKALKQLEARDPCKAAAIAECKDILGGGPPTAAAPWVPLLLLFERRTVLHELCSLVVFSAMFTSLTCLPAQLSAPPYGLSAGLVGLVFLPGGVAALAGSAFGGWCSDRAAACRPDVPMHRMVFSNYVAMGMAVSLLVYGWGLQLQLPLAVVVVGQALVSACCDLYFPGMMAYLTTINQQAAATASAGLNGTLFLATGVLILVAAASIQATGTGIFFSAVAALQAVLAGAAMLQTHLAPMPAR